MSEGEMHDSPQETDDAVTQETPAFEETPPAAAADATEPAPPPNGAGDAKRTGSYVRIPTWIAAIVAVLVLVGGGFALGRMTAPDDGNEVSFQIPQGQGDSEPFPVPRFEGTAFLGVATRPADGTQGVEIVEITDGSAAEDAGLRTGDVITEVDGEAIESAAELRAAILSHEPGDEVTITYTRDGNSNEATVELGERPSTNN